MQNLRGLNLDYLILCCNKHNYPRSQHDRRVNIFFWSVKSQMPFLTSYIEPLCILLLLACCTFSSPAVADTFSPNYQLSVSFNPEKSSLTGTARITIKKGQKLTLSLFHLKVTGTLLQDETGSEHELTSTGDMLILPATDSRRVLYISYIRQVYNEANNLISGEGISLTNNWYPRPEEPMLFSVSAELPESFEAILEAEQFPLPRVGNMVTARFSKPTTSIHLIAGPYRIEKQKVREGLFVYTMFFDEDQELAQKYLDAAAKYLGRYETELGNYPFDHYVIVANRQPTGFGMPTFTLLGQMVLRLPFIINTSLGHEIVHSWFGNGVDVDYSEGNWCEGLTSYLSDYRYREDKNEGVTGRKESIIKYHSYVHDDSKSSLADFISASHNQPMADARRAVGYNRGAMLFHELREKIGDGVFNSGLRNFYKNFVGKVGSWENLKKSFEDVANEDLSAFFSERLFSSEIPSLSVSDISVKHQGGKPTLDFTLKQQSTDTFSLDVPIQIKTMSSTFTVTEKIQSPEKLITIPLLERPLEFTIDPGYSFLRTLDSREYPAVWSRFLGATDKLVVLADENEKEIYQPFLDTLETDHLHVVTSAEVLNKDLSEHSLLFLGVQQGVIESLFGTVDHSDEGVTLEVRNNPLSPDQVAVLLSSESKKESQLVARRLKHYGKYSYLQFKNGRKQTGYTDESDNGLRFTLEQLPQGGATSTISSFEAIADKLTSNDVIYIGESHTSLPDHLLQLRLIQALHQRHKNIAIGMEMFPTSSQAALDQYILEDRTITEIEFLKASDYFNVWRYDYRFFRDILNYAKKHKIPVVGLNLQREIVSQIFREGGTDDLSKEAKATLPADRDLDMDGYVERLSQTHSAHIRGNHASGSFAGFIQSQGLWDETMASNIVSFLQSNPSRKMIVLAGSQHTRKDSGIPPRVKRRMEISQASVLNIYDTNSPTNLQQVADYYFLAAYSELSSSPKIGIVLAPEQTDDSTSLKIIQLSPHGNALEAGLKIDDILLEVAGVKISEMADLRIAMLDSIPGEFIEVKVKRNKNGSEQKLSFTIELTLPPSMPAHP